MEASISPAYNDGHLITCKINFKAVLKTENESKEALTEKATLSLIF